MSRQYFGTDGIRGKVGEYPITPEFVLKLGWAAGRVLCRGHAGKGKVLIGKDTRVSGYMFESALQAGLSAAGVDVLLSGPMPTPAVAYLTHTLHAQAGIVISASHNPYHDNGIKFFSADGTKLDDEIELAIEAELEKQLDTVESSKLGKAQRVVDASGRYIEYCKSTVPRNLDLTGMKIVVDCANGATYHVAGSVFRERGAEVIEIGVDPDGFNINEQCGALHPELLRAAVLDQGADLGIALDGDGDRVMMVDHTGNILDGDDLLYVIARHRLCGKGLGRDKVVVGTLMSNLGFEKALARHDVTLIRTQVGDRYVLESMKQSGLVLGGETSGHIICLDRTSTGDGIIAALQVLAALSGMSRSLNDISSEVSKTPQIMINVKADASVVNNQTTKAAVAAAEADLGDKGRVLLRPSGTEPVVRVMVEGEDDSQVERLAHEIAAVIRAEPSL
ncbi:phosphoglucosamine mutase [Gammaproteobacteria bacterium AH-315-C21]|nr:phosphoglucosamine mutase [Gammaproteobacteria bacterium AH-315-C21]